MGNVHVYTWEPNSNAGKPLFALAEKGVAFEYHYQPDGLRAARARVPEDQSRRHGADAHP
jgi:hypothetical protein